MCRAAITSFASCSTHALRVRLLAALLRALAVLSRAQFMDRVWGNALASGDRTVAPTQTCGKLREVAPELDPSAPTAAVIRRMDPREHILVGPRPKNICCASLGYFRSSVAGLLLHRCFFAESSPAFRRRWKNTLATWANVLA